MNIELIGLFGSIIILTSMALPSTHRRQNIIMRLVNACGSIVMVWYGIQIGSYCNVLLNSVAIIMHIYYITKLYLSIKNNIHDS